MSEHELLSNLGSLLAGQGRIDDAVKLLGEAARKSPKDAGAHYRLAVALGMAGRTDDAVRSYRRAIALDPGHAEAHNNLANILQRTNRPAEAIPHYERALARRPAYLEARYNFGRALAVVGKFDAAQIQFEQAVALKPDFAEAHASLAEVHMWLGRPDEARRAIETAIDLAPTKPGFYRLLARLKVFAEGDPHLAALETLEKKAATLAPEEEADLRLALAKAYDDLGRWEGSFAQLTRSNAIRRGRIDYDEAGTLALIESCRSLMSRDVISASRGRADRPEAPIFIVGMPRSGSSLLEQILASHPALFGVGETDAFGAAVSAVARTGSSLLTSGLLSENRLRRLGSGYVTKTSALVPPGRRLVDKTLRNFLFVGLIHLVFPNARILHIRRDPLDTCLSCFSTAFEGDFPYAYDLGELGRYYRAYEALTQHWHRVLPEGVLLEIDYERLVDDFEPQVRRVLAHCGLEWHDACRSFHQAHRAVRTASAVQVRQPLYRSAIGRAEPYRPLLKPFTDALRQD